MENDIILQCKDTSFGYETGIVLSNLSLTVKKGDYIAIMGENGVGKTTLIKGILGLIKPVSGTIERDKNAKTGYLPQQTQSQRNFPSSVYEIVLSGFSSKLFHTKEEKKAVLEKLEMLNISNLKNRCYRELSGGQQQRVLLARALCSADSLIVLDEPTTGLDPLATADFYSLIKELNENKNIAVLMVSHDVEKAVKEAKHILYVHSDKFIFSDSKSFAHMYFDL